MAIKFRFFTLLMIFITYFTFAQTETNNASSYTTEETTEGTRFIQRLDWAPIDGIVRYEIILERRFGNSNRYDAFLTETTEAPFLEMSLPAGNYRYKVLGYNILNRLGAESNYQPFEIFQAVMPRVNAIASSELILEEDSRSITLNGENFVLGGEIYLVPAASRNNSVDQTGVLVPSEVIYSDIGDSVELDFGTQELPPGKYRIVVVNPGGLTSTYPFEIKKLRKPMDINVSAGYAPLVPINFDNEFNNFNNVISDAFYPLGFTARVSVVPIKTEFGYFGLELSPFYSYAESASDFYTFNMHILGASLSILYQIPFFNEKLFFNIALGGGFASFVNMQFDYANDKNEAVSFIFPETQVRLSGQYFVYKQLFVELGMDFKFFFPENLLMGYIIPNISVGWKF